MLVLKPNGTSKQDTQEKQNGGRKYKKNEGEVWRGKQSTNTEGDKSIKKAQKEDKHNNSNTTNYG